MLAFIGYVSAAMDTSLSEVPNEKADHSPDGRRVRRHDFQCRSADALRAGDNRAIRDPGDTRQGGEQEDRQVGGKKKAKGKSKKVESKS